MKSIKKKIHLTDKNGEKYIFNIHLELVVATGIGQCNHYKLVIEIIRRKDKSVITSFQQSPIFIIKDIIDSIKKGEFITREYFIYPNIENIITQRISLHIHPENIVFVINNISNKNSSIELCLNEKNVLDLLYGIGDVSGYKKSYLNNKLGLTPKLMTERCKKINLL
jgi:hypothetical protein